MGDFDPAAKRRWELLNQDKTRSQAIIAQSNNRASGLAQLLGTVLTLIGIMTAVLVAIKGIAVTRPAIVAAVVAVVALVTATISLATTMWPRLGELPKDKTSLEYKVRLMTAAEQHMDQSPTVSDYAEGYFLQRIAHVKERGTQGTLVALVVLVVASIAAFAAIHY